MIYLSRQRVREIDIFKALAIFLVVLGHCPIVNPSLKQMVYAFHMPAFFAAYGLSYDLSRHCEKGGFTSRFIKNKFIRLMIPCFLFGMIYSQLTIRNLAYIVYGSQKAFYCTKGLSSLWFLPCFFLAVCFFEALIHVLLIKMKLNEKTFSFHLFLIITAVIAAIISYILPDMQMGYPWSVNVAFMALVFIICGYEMREVIRNNIILNNANIVIWMASMIISGLILVSTFRLNLAHITKNNIDMASATFGVAHWFFITAFSGIIFLFACAVIIQRFSLSKWFVLVGENTFLIFILHKPIIIKLSNYISSHWAGGAKLTGNYLIISIMVVIISLFLSLAIKKGYKYIENSM